jgi:hypothetical protein
MDEEILDMISKMFDSHYRDGITDGIGIGVIIGFTICCIIAFIALILK